MGCVESLGALNTTRLCDWFFSGVCVCVDCPDLIIDYLGKSIYPLGMQKLSSNMPGRISVGFLMPRQIS